MRQSSKPKAAEPATPIEQAKSIAAGKNLVVIPKLTSSGGVRSWCVYRKMASRKVFVGERVTPEKTLALVRRLA